MDEIFVAPTVQYQDGAVIKVIGVGGAGGNAIDNMIASDVKDVQFITMNTDLRALKKNKAPQKILLSTNGLGAGCKPEVGKQYAVERLEDIRSAISGADMVFIACGMGGGTGTGASPVIAAEAKSQNALTVAVVIMPMTAEGNNRCEVAKQGLQDLIEYVDAYIVIPNDGLQDAGHKKNLFEAFKLADNVLCQSVIGISELAIGHGSGYINIDFEDIRTAMTGKGKSVMGIGRASGEGRTRLAFEEALKSPLIADTSIMGSFMVLVNICGNQSDMTMDEFTELTALANEQAGKEANIKFGITYDDRDDGTVSVIVIATGISGKKSVPVTELKPKLPAAINEMETKIKVISKRDRNLRSFKDANEEKEIFTVPTFVRKQAD